MPRNIEIKARARNLVHQTQLVQKHATSGPEYLSQEDTFFNVPTGRLKLREFGTGRGELIQYHRPDSLGPTESRYVIATTKEPHLIKKALNNALGVRAVVTKERTVYFLGQTRIHLDRVVGLGEFIELEVVLKPDDHNLNGETTAQELMKLLEIENSDLVRPAYIDLLTEQR